jgi:hypothetical protein
MSRVLIVSRTRMNKGRVCVGGHDLDQDFRSIRLLTPSGMNMPEDKPLAVGAIWDLDYADLEDPDPPHVEDVNVSGGKRVDSVPRDQLADYLVEHIEPWRGSPEEIFDGTVAATPSGRVYVPEDGPLPTQSTGYWIPDAEVLKRISFDKVRYLYTGTSTTDEFTWAGTEDPPEQIAAGTLVRVSLARWFNPSSAPAGYYAQISGVYLGDDSQG